MPEKPKEKEVTDRKKPEESSPEKDQKRRGYYYYDDAHGYKIYDPEDEDEED